MQLYSRVVWCAVSVHGPSKPGARFCSYRVATVGSGATSTELVARIILGAAPIGCPLLAWERTGTMRPAMHTSISRRHGIRVDGELLRRGDSERRQRDEESVLTHCQAGDFRWSEKQMFKDGWSLQIVAGDAALVADDVKCKKSVLNFCCCCGRKRPKDESNRGKGSSELRQAASKTQAGFRHKVGKSFLKGRPASDWLNRGIVAGGPGFCNGAPSPPSQPPPACGVLTISAFGRGAIRSWPEPTIPRHIQKQLPWPPGWHILDHVAAAKTAHY